jgi:hypothetical protein
MPLSFSLCPTSSQICRQPIEKPAADRGGLAHLEDVGGARVEALLQLQGLRRAVVPPLGGGLRSWPKRSDILEWGTTGHVRAAEQLTKYSTGSGSLQYAGHASLGGCRGESDGPRGTLGCAAGLGLAAGAAAGARVAACGPALTSDTLVTAGAGRRSAAAPFAVPTCSQRARMCCIPGGS